MPTTPAKNLLYRAALPILAPQPRADDTPRIRTSADDSAEL